MNKLRLFFTSRRLLMRQLQEAWEERDAWEEASHSWKSAAKAADERHERGNSHLKEQLHRVARERYKERRLRLEAEALLAENEEE